MNVDHRLRPPRTALLTVLAAALAAWTGPAAAADIVTYERCRDQAGRPVDVVLDQELDRVALAHRRADGSSVIYHDPWALPELLPETREFLHAHECAHLQLGHSSFATQPAHEWAADCRAFELLREERGYSWTELAAIEVDLNSLRGGWHEIRGPRRKIDARACLHATGARPPEAVPCTHRVPCTHLVPCSHALHAWDHEHAFDVGWNGRAIECQHRRPCEHFEHPHDVAHRYDLLHQHDWR